MDTADESDAYELLIGLAISFVSYRPRSEREFRQFLDKKLRTRHMSAPDVVSRVLQRLKELHYLDDAAFARWWVSQRTGRKAKGPQAIAAELTRKGIGREILEGALRSAVPDSASEREMAKKTALPKLRVWGALPVLERKRKLAAFLSRRGFSSEVVWGVVDDMCRTV